MVNSRFMCMDIDGLTCAGFGTCTHKGQSVGRMGRGLSRMAEDGDGPKREV
jgi:hypothetical protein